MAEPVGPTLVAMFFAAVATVAVWFLLRLMADPRREPEIPQEVMPYKLRLNGLLRAEAWAFLAVGVFAVVRIAGSHALAGDGCDASITAWMAAAAGLDHLAVALSGAAWGVGIFAVVRHVRRLRSLGWSDPKAKDLVILHVVLIPIALFALLATLTVTANRFCPS